MQFTTHAPPNIFNDELREYCEQKLTRPLTRLGMDQDPASVDAEARKHTEGFELKVKVRLVGVEPFNIHVVHADPYAMIDGAAAKMKRSLREIESKRRARRRAMGELPSLDDETEDIFTDGEEEVLREMGALDAVLDL